MSGGKEAKMSNDSFFLWIKAIIVSGVGAFGAAFGWLGGLVFIWVACMATDWISGSAAAAAKGNWSSATARAGIWHKCGMLLVVLVAFLADSVLGIVVQNLPVLGIHYTVLVLPVVLVWYIFTELGSIAENAAEMGAPVPPGLLKLLAVSRQMTEDRLDDLDDTEEGSKK